MRNLLIVSALVFLSVAPAAADGIPVPPEIPTETGEEICRGELKVTEADLATCDAGLSSCSQDRAVAMKLLNQCLGNPDGTTLDEIKKQDVKAPPKSKRKVRRKVKRKRTPKVAPKLVVGPQGPVGKDGSNGHSLVWSLRTLKPGKTCPAGGYLKMFGLDSNDNGTLDPIEAADLMAICHGRNGHNGKDGKDGVGGDRGVRPTVSTGTFANALYAKGRPQSYALFAVASLAWPMNDTVSFTIEGGAAPGLDAAMLLRASLDFRLGSTSGLKIGALYEVIGLTDNNYANDQFIMLTVGVYKDLCLYKGDAVNLSLRGEVSGILGVDGFINAGRKPRIAGGAGGGLGLHFEF